MMGHMADQTMQTVLSIGVPSLSVLVGILINNSRLSDLRTDLRGAITVLRITVDKRFDDSIRLQDANLRLQDANLRRVEEVLDARLRHIEEKLKIA